jgi:hypothetical protein
MDRLLHRVSGGTDMSVTLPEELLLLFLDDVAGSVRGDSVALEYGLAGAQLLELTLAGRIDVVDKRLVVLNPEPIGDADLDRMLERINDKKRPPKPNTVVAMQVKSLKKPYLARLAEQGLISEERRRLLGIIPVRRYPAVDSVVEDETTSRLRAALIDGADPEPRTAALVTLLLATGLLKKVFPDADRGALKRRAKEISEGEWAGKAVSNAVASVYAAIAAGAAAGAGAGSG